MAILDTFIALRNYVKGKIDRFDLESSDEMISEVRENSQNRGQSTVIVEYQNEEEFLSAMGLGDDDNWFYRGINSPYSDYEFYDWYSAKEDFENGWGGIYSDLDDENKEKLIQISKVILPMKPDFDNEKFRNRLSEKLLTNFREETEYIISDYQTERNYEAMGNARKLINDDFNDYLDRFGFVPYNDGFKTSVANLIMLYLKENKIHLSLKDLIDDVTNKSSAPGGWAEDPYQFMTGEGFDKESFNNYTSRKLDDILEKIVDVGDSDSPTIQDFTEMTDRITKKFEQDKYYNLPKDSKKETRFKIEEFEYPAMKVVVILQKGFKQRMIKLSEDNFYNLLYQPTLFNLDEI